MDEYSPIHRSLPMSIPIKQDLAVIDERMECLRIAENRLKLAQMCGSADGVAYCEMVIKAITDRGTK